MGTRQVYEPLPETPPKAIPYPTQYPASLEKLPDQARHVEIESVTHPLALLHELIRRGVINMTQTDYEQWVQSYQTQTPEHPTPQQKKDPKQWLATCQTMANHIQKKSDVNQITVSVKKHTLTQEEKDDTLTLSLFKQLTDIRISLIIETDAHSLASALEHYSICLPPTAEQVSEPAEQQQPNSTDILTHYLPHIVAEPLSTLLPRLSAETLSTYLTAKLNTHIQEAKLTSLRFLWMAIRIIHTKLNVEQPTPDKELLKAIFAIVNEIEKHDPETLTRKELDRKNLAAFNQQVSNLIKHMSKNDELLSATGDIQPTTTQTQQAYKFMGDDIIDLCARTINKSHTIAAIKTQVQTTVTAIHIMNRAYDLWTENRLSTEQYNELYDLTKQLVEKPVGSSINQALAIIVQPSLGKWFVGETLLTTSLAAAITITIITATAGAAIVPLIIAYASCILAAIMGYQYQKPSTDPKISTSVHQFYKTTPIGFKPPPLSSEQDDPLPTIITPGDYEELFPPTPR